jgi:septum formation protein
MISLPAIYLASQSPRRQQLLTQIGVPFELLLPEDAVAAEALENKIEGESPRTYVRRVTLLKLKAAIALLKKKKMPLRPVLTADTTVTLEGNIFGKPVDDNEAQMMLKNLSGHTHQVLTAVAIGDGFKMICRIQCSHVSFSPMTEEDISNYVKTGEPKGKAGAYAIQGIAAGFVKRISGSHSGIMGLPVYETRQILLEWMKD